jgi:hypothetical protein
MNRREASHSNTFTTALRRSRNGLWLTTGILAAAGAAQADEPPAQPPMVAPVEVAMQAPAAAPTPAPATKPKPKRQLILSGSWRLRQEVWDWFGSGDEGKYTYTGSLLRYGGLYTTPDHDLSLELAQPTLLNLPQDATLGAPLGQLGQGPSYRDGNLGQEGSLFVKQAFWRAKNLGSPANSARLGRFEVVDGTETMPKDPSLGFLKRERVAHRLLGTFGFTHVGRSFDGGQFVHNTPDLNVTLFGGMPTEGVFDLDGGTTLDDIKIGYAAVTRPFKADGFQGEARLFGLQYVDDRQGVVMVDNRPGPVLAADTNNLSISTVGGHALGLWETSGGKFDGLLWGAGQFGDFGSQSHSAYAFAIEAGYQPKAVPWSPWFRAGFNRYSGDNDATDNDHGTFFPVLPTPRIYARFPFFTLSNLNDAFAQVVLKPTPKLTVRSDIHALWLAEKNDLWYIGGGAFNRPTFGYGGRPSNNNSGLATLLDLSADFQVRKYTTLSGYIGYAFGGDVVDSIYSGGGNGFLGYVELTQKF